MTGIHTPPLPPTLVGVEWFIDAIGCDAERLRDLAALRRLCGQILAELELTVLGQPLWHRFGGAAGVTGLYLLTESHLACHTYPEYGTATFSLYCCRPRPRWSWEERLAAALGAAEVRVGSVPRGGEGEP